MTRAAVCGNGLERAAAVLGLEVVDVTPDVVLVDASDAAAVTRAAEIPAAVPRIVVASAEQEELLRAAGMPIAAIARSAEPAAIGPLIAAALPAVDRRRTRLVVVTGVAGGSGRTLLCANVAARLAERGSTLLIDATGSGAAAWWLGLSPGPWSDLEGLVEELTPEHLAVVAAERDRLRAIGGAAHAPSVALVDATRRAADGLGDLVLVDAPVIYDERTRALIPRADRAIVVCGADPSSLASLDAVSADIEGAWMVASRARSGALGTRDVLRAIPDDPGSVRTAASGPFLAGGALGRAYDELADLIAIDAA